jgi:hypothetical protein
VSDREYRPQQGEPSQENQMQVYRPASAGETAGTALAVREKAMVEARYTIALNRPRNIDAAWQRLERECKRPAFAQHAIYRKPIGEGIEGPSIRLAEAAAQALGNILVETPTWFDDIEKRIMRVVVVDLESNMTYSKDVTIMKRVERSRLGEGQTAIRQRVNSRGRTVYLVEATDDEILNTENALVSKALRTLLLRVIPGWMIEEAMLVVRATRANENARDPDDAKRRVLSAFASLNVTVEQLTEYLGHDAGQLAPKELDELRALYTTLKEGETTWKEVADARAAEREPAAPAAQNPEPAQGGVESLKKKLARGRSAGQSEQPPASTPAAPATPAPAPQREPGEEG